MEERFETFICPNCGNEMHRGITSKSQRPFLDWFPGRQAPSKLDELKVPDAKKTADISRGVRFVGSVWNWYINYHPSWYCHDCGLLLIDTKVELER